MKVGTRILAMLVALCGGACHKSGSGQSSAPGGSVAEPTPDPPIVEPVHLESLYMNTSVRLAEDVPPARTVTLTLSKASDTEMMGTLILDPNVCSLDDFGDRRGCTRIAVRGLDVELRRVSRVDPANLGRRLFEVTGEGVPRGLSLIVRGDLREGKLERCYLKLGAELVPLFLEDGA